MMFTKYNPFISKHRLGGARVSMADNSSKNIKISHCRQRALSNTNLKQASQNFYGPPQTAQNFYIREQYCLNSSKKKPF